MPEKEYYGIGEKPIFPGLSSYREPFIYELAGKSFHLIMDSGKEYYLNFLTGTFLEWSKNGKKAKKNNYECLKCDDTTYFVNMEVKGTEPRKGITFILDLENRLTTIVEVRQGERTEYPNLVTVKHGFGVIDVPGMELPEKRHEYTEELVGKRILWNYSPDGLAIIHVYYDKKYMTVTNNEGEGMATRMSRERYEEFQREREKYPYNEPTIYIKVKEGIYIVCCNESHSAKRGKMGNNLLFLMDLKRVHDVGRSFGIDGNSDPENYTFSAFGTWTKSDGELEAKSRNNPYLEADKLDPTYTKKI